MTVRHHGVVSANLLVQGDNLGVLPLLPHASIRCAYLDPPFNTGRTFAEYKDTWNGQEWTRMMRPRLEAIRPLLTDDGSIWVEIDDTQLAPLTILLDEIFGAKNRISTITVVRSAPTGHKAINAGPVNVSDFVLAYAKDKKKWRGHPTTTQRDGWDRAYGTWLENPDDKPARWKFRPLKAVVAEVLGYASTRAASRALMDFDNRVEMHALANAAHVVRFAQPRYEAISKAAQAIVDRSRENPDKVFVLLREKHPPFIVRGANRILFLKDKVTLVDGKPAITEPLTNVWTDMPFQGIAREGGVVFSRNKKPERLLERILSIATDPDDAVLDPFLGSGTTAAVAHKMGRRWTGIESGAHAETLAEARLARVVRGEDRTGLPYAGGGGFSVARLDAWRAEHLPVSPRAKAI